MRVAIHPEEKVAFMVGSPATSDSVWSSKRTISIAEFVWENWVASKSDGRAGTTITSPAAPSHRSRPVDMSPENLDNLYVITQYPCAATHSCKNVAAADTSADLTLPVPLQYSSMTLKQLALTWYLDHEGDGAADGTHPNMLLRHGHTCSKHSIWFQESLDIAIMQICPEYGASTFVLLSQ
jgi:hypothetical protein